MEATLTQPCRVQEDGPMGCKLLFCKNNVYLVRYFECITGISTG